MSEAASALRREIYVGFLRVSPKSWGVNAWEMLP